MKKKKKINESLYAKALTKMPFEVPFVDSRYLCRLCNKKGVKIRYFYLIKKDFPSSLTFCSEKCLAMYRIRRL